MYCISCITKCFDVWWLWEQQGTLQLFWWNCVCCVHFLFGVKGISEIQMKWVATSNVCCFQFMWIIILTNVTMCWIDIKNKKISIVRFLVVERCFYSKWSRWTKCINFIQRRQRNIIYGKFDDCQRTIKIRTCEPGTSSNRRRHKHRGSRSWRDTDHTFDL